MRNTHEPSSEFVERLEWQVGREVRRRNRAAEVPPWTPRSRMKAAVAVLGLMLVSMGIGAAAVAAAYEAQGHERRDQLVSSFEQRVQLARQRLAIASEQLQGTERRVEVGTANSLEIGEGRFRVAEAEAQLKSLELQLDEVRITGREPRDEMSSPLVSGRDFVSQRLRIEMSVPETALALERARLQNAERRVQVGMADPVDVEVSRVRALEVALALDALRRKIEIRQKFLTGGADAVETELRVLESEAEQRKKTLAPKVELARKDTERISARVQIGTAQSVELAETTLKQLQLQTELSKAELDLALTRRQIEQHRAAR